MIVRRFCTFLICSFFLNLCLQAQNPLPRYMTAEEQTIVNKGEYTPPTSMNLSPPPGPVRVPAEWEEMDAVIIVWEAFSSILAQITDALKEDVEVIIVCPNIN